MNTYRRYRCEWRVNILARDPKEAAQKAEELMRGVPSSYWVIIDEHGNEQTFEVPPLGRLPTRCVCEHDSDDVCEAQQPGGTLLCCREQGHVGEHVACSDRHVIARW